MHVTTVGLDLAKHVFQVHGIDQNGQVLIRRQLPRGERIGFFRRFPPCLTGMEACSTAHFWARELAALGHEVRLMPAAYVKPYVKRGKSDALDAAGICEAVTCPTMRYVAIKNPEQQAALMLHRTRDLLVRQRTMLVNALRGHLAEYGIIAPQGLASVPKLIALAEKACGTALPDLAWRCIRLIVAQIEDVHGRIGQVEHEILAWHRTNELSQRLETIPGIGLITASTLGGPHPGSALLPLGPPLGGLDRLGATPEWDGRQGAARAHLQTRGSISAPASGARGHDTLATCPRQSLSGCGMDQRALGPPPSQRGQDCHCQQADSGRLAVL
jgi:transposase